MAASLGGLNTSQYYVADAAAGQIFLMNAGYGTLSSPAVTDASGQNVDPTGKLFIDTSKQWVSAALVSSVVATDSGSLTINFKSSGLTWTHDGAGIETINSGSNSISIDSKTLTSVSKAADGNPQFNLGTGGTWFEIDSSGSLIVHPTSGDPVTFGSGTWSSHVKMTSSLLTDLYGDPFGTLTLNLGNGDVAVTDLVDGQTFDLGTNVGAVTLTGNNTQNTLVGSNGDQSLIAGEDNDTLIGDLGSMSFSGGNGDETFFGGDGTDTLISGSDEGTIADFGHANGTLVLTEGSGGVSVSGFDDTDTLSSLPTIILNGTAATIIGGSGSETYKQIASGSTIDLRSGGGVTLSSSNGALVAGGDTFMLNGAVTLDVSGTVSITGPSLPSGVKIVDQGQATLDLSKFTGGSVNVDLSQGTFTAGGSLSLSGFSTVIANNNADTLKGGDGPSTLIAGDGNDILIGGSGPATLIGGKGADVFKAQAGDVIEGLKEGDTVYFNGLPVNGLTQYGDDVDAYGLTYSFAGDYSSVTVSGPGGSITINAADGQFGDDGKGGGNTGSIFSPDPNEKKKEPPWLPGFPNSETVYSPLVLDLSGTGINTTPVSAGVSFDLNNTGFKLQTGWIGSGSGLLVYDPTGGAVTNGSQLFGTATKLPNGQSAHDGFQALAQYDDNGDGVINAYDLVWSSLRVWVGGDGTPGSGQLLTMAQAGVAAINLNSAASSTVQAGNTIGLTGTFTTTAGTTHAIDDVWFQTDPTLSSPVTNVPIPTDIAALPNLRGFGTLPGLQQAMALDQTGQLEVLVKQFIAATSDAQRSGLVDQIIYQWAGVENVAPNSRTGTGNSVDARQLGALEAFTGEPWVGPYGNSDPSPTANQAIAATYSTLHDWVYAGLTVQTNLQPWMQAVALSVNSTTKLPYADFGQVESLVLAGLASDRSGTLSDLATFNQTINTMGLDLGSGFAAFRNALVQQGTDVAATFLFGTSVVYGTDGPDVIDAWVGNQTIYGGPNSGVFGVGSDIFIDDGQNETFIGGSANDPVSNDIYSYTAGNGHMVIIEGSAQSGGQNTLVLNGVSRSNVSFSGSGYPVCQ